MIHRAAMYILAFRLCKGTLMPGQSYLSEESSFLLKKFFTVSRLSRCTIISPYDLPAHLLQLLQSTVLYLLLAGLQVSRYCLPVALYAWTELSIQIPAWRYRIPMSVAYMIVVTLLCLNFLVRITSFLLQAELAAQDLPGFLEEKLQPSQAP